MKKITMLSVVVLVVLFSSTACFAKGRICKKQSFGMKPADAIIWTMANPNECGMDFLGLSREVKYDFEKLSKAEKERSITKKLVQKNVTDMEAALTGKFSFNYFGALDYENYYEYIIAYKKQGFKTSIDEMSLRMHLQNKIKEQCSHVLRIMKGKEDAHQMDNKTFEHELAQMMKKYGIAFQDFGTTESEVRRLARK